MYSELVHFGKLTPPQRGRIPEMTMQVFKNFTNEKKAHAGGKKSASPPNARQRLPTPANTSQRLPTPPNASQHLPTPPNSQLIQVVRSKKLNVNPHTALSLFGFFTDSHCTFAHNVRKRGGVTSKKFNLDSYSFNSREGHSLLILKWGKKSAKGKLGKRLKSWNAKTNNSHGNMLHNTSK